MAEEGVTNISALANCTTPRCLEVCPFPISLKLEMDMAYLCTLNSSTEWVPSPYPCTPEVSVASGGFKRT